MNIKKILLLIIPIFILFGFGITETKKVFSQPVCEVVDLSFSPNGNQGATIFIPKNIQIIVETNGECSGSSVKINVRETDFAENIYFETILNNFSETNKFATILTSTGNTPPDSTVKCFANKCDLWLGSEVSGNQFTTENQSTSGKGRLIYTATANNPIVEWPKKEVSAIYSSDGKTDDSGLLGSCYAKINALYLTDQESGDSKTFNKAGNPTLTAEGETDGCSPDNGTMKIGLVVTDDLLLPKDDIDNTMMTIRNVQGGFMRFKIVWKLGEKDCNYFGLSPAKTFCEDLQVAIYLPDSGRTLSEQEYTYAVTPEYTAKFSILSSEVFDKSGAPISVLGSGFKNSNVGLKTSPCYVEDPNGDGKTDDAGLKDGCLGLLAPLPDFDRFEAGANPFTNWINTILRVIIGISTLLAVVMLVIMGAQYMSSSLVTSKANAKSRIADIFIGLGLLLGIFIILNLINPNLLNLDPNVPVAELLTGGDGFGTELKPGAAPAGKFSNSAAEIAYIKQNGKTITLTKKSGGTISVPPCDEPNMTTVTVFNSSFKVHSSVAPSINRINQKWAAQNPKYVIPASEESRKAMGGYVCRLTNDKKKVSNHAYGLAVDINPKENPHKIGLTTNMPQSFIQLWKDEGWGWGGDWNGQRKDPMHFSKLGNEGGDEKVD